MHNFGSFLSNIALCHGEFAQNGNVIGDNLSNGHVMGNMWEVTTKSDLLQGKHKKKTQVPE